MVFYLLTLYIHATKVSYKEHILRVYVPFSHSFLTLVAVDTCWRKEGRIEQIKNKKVEKYLSFIMGIITEGITTLCIGNHSESEFDIFIVQIYVKIRDFFVKINYIIYWFELLFLKAKISMNIQSSL